MLLLFVFIIGLVMGSFLNVAAIRSLNNENIVYPPSHCTNCGHRLGFLDLFPVLSYVFLKGRCRYCHKKISPIYPFGELLTAAAYTVIFYKFTFTLNTLLQIVFISIMIICCISDILKGQISKNIINIGCIIILILRIIVYDDMFKYIADGIIVFAVMFIIYKLTKDKIGFADVKLIAVSAVSLGLLNTFCSVFYASCIGVILNIKRRKRKIPFIPYLTIGIIITYIVNVFNIWG